MMTSVRTMESFEPCYLQMRDGINQFMLFEELIVQFLYCNAVFFSLVCFKLPGTNNVKILEGIDE